MSIIIQRRSFLIGLASLVASPAIAGAERFTGPISVGVIKPRLAYRRISDITFSSMPTGEQLRANFIEDPVKYAFMAGENTLYAVTMNPRATFRYAMISGDMEWVVDECHPFRAVIEPAHHTTTMSMVFNIERNQSARRRMFSESYRWENGKLVMSEVHALDPLDGDLLVAA